MKSAIPRVNASRTTFPELQSSAFAGIVDRLMAANEFSSSTNSYLREARNGRFRESLSVVREQLDRFVCGEPIDADKLKSDLESVTVAFAALAAAASEIATLVGDNPGTMTTVFKFNNPSPKNVRTFP
jgi:hypothetical protein